MARRSFWLFLPLLLALFLGLSFQGTRGLVETSETRYAECAREMLVSGNWMEPTLEFEPHWTKPPLTYWFMAVGLKLFGVNAWGARMPAVLALLIAVGAVSLAGRRLWGRKAGLIAGLAMALGLPTMAANMTTTDIHLLASQAVAGTLFLHAATEPETARRRSLTRWMWVLWGVCFLIKGPPALLPLLAMIPWNRMQPRERRVPLGDPLGLLLGCGVGLSWYLVMVGRHPELLQYFVGTEIVDRVASDLGHNRAWYKAFEVYLPAMLAVFGIFGLWAGLHAFRSGWWRPARWRELLAARDERLLLVGWVVLPLLVFSISTSKLPLYVLPLCVPAALLCAAVLTKRIRLARLGNVVLVLTPALLGLKAAAAYWPNERDMAALAADIRAELEALPADTPIVLWDRPKNHGIAFYLDLEPARMPWKVTTGSKGAFDDFSVEEFVQRLRSSAAPQQVLLIAPSRSRATRDPESLLPSGWIAAERRSEFWRILRVQVPRQGEAGSGPH